MKVGDVYRIEHKTVQPIKVFTIGIVTSPGRHFRGCEATFMQTERSVSLLTLETNITRWDGDSNLIWLRDVVEVPEVPVNG